MSCLFRIAIPSSLKQLISQSWNFDQVYSTYCELPPVEQASTVIRKLFATLIVTLHSFTSGKFLLPGQLMLSSHILLVQTDPTLQSLIFSVYLPSLKYFHPQQDPTHTLVSQISNHLFFEMIILPCYELLSCALGALYTLTPTQAHLILHSFYLCHLP